MARGKKKKTAEKSASGKEKNAPQQTEGGSPGGTDSELQEHVTPIQTSEEVNTSQTEPPKCEQQGCGRVATCTVTVEIGEDLNAPTTAEAWACDDCATNAHLNGLVIASFQPLTALTTRSPVETEDEEVLFEDATMICEAGFCTTLPDVSVTVETQDCNLQTLNVCNEHNSEEALQVKRIISTKPYDSITVPPSEYSVSLTETTTKTDTQNIVEQITRQQIEAFNTSEKKEAEKRTGREKRDTSLRSARASATPYRAPKVSTSVNNMTIDPVATQSTQSEEINSISLIIGNDTQSFLKDTTPRMMICYYAQARNESPRKWQMVKGTEVLPYSRSLGSLAEEGIIQSGDHVQFRRMDRSSTPSPQQNIDIDSPQRNIDASIHNPKNKQSEVYIGSLGSDAVNPNSVPPMQKHLEEANIKAFSGTKSFANAAKGKDKGPGVHFGEESGALSRTICRLKEELTTGRPVPATDMCNVVFWDIKGLPVTEDELKEAILETGAIGCVHRKSAGWIEVAYSTIE